MAGRWRYDNYRRFTRYKTRKMSSGRQMTDEVTGLPAFEDDLAEDAYGNLVDTRHPENFDNPDTYLSAGRITLPSVETPASVGLLSPLQLAGCILWLPPSLDALPGVVNDGDAITTWRDWSPLGNHASGGTSPHYKVAVQNNLPMALFNQLSLEYLRCDGLAASLGGSDTPYSMAMVFKKLSNVITQTAVAVGRSTIVTQSLRAFTTTVSTYVTGKTDDAGVNVGVNGVGAAPDTDAHVWVSRHSGTVINATLDNIALMTAQSQNVGVMTVDRGGIGALVRSVVQQYWDGYLGEIVGYNRELTDDEAILLKNYLMTKWGLS